jgi:hypothetical protein
MPIYNRELFESQPDLLKGNLQIIACAGSGKTEFVSERIAYQIYKGMIRNDTFHNQGQSYRTKKDRSLDLSTDPYKYPLKVDYRVMVKVVDIFGNDTTHIIQLQHR